MARPVQPAECRACAVCGDVFKNFGLTGLGVFAALQINFVSFAAPVANG